MSLFCFHDWVILRRPQINDYGHIGARSYAVEYKDQDYNTTTIERYINSYSIASQIADKHSDKICSKCNKLNLALKSIIDKTASITERRHEAQVYGKKLLNLADKS